MNKRWTGPAERWSSNDGLRELLTGFGEQPFDSHLEAQATIQAAAWTQRQPSPQRRQRTIPTGFVMASPGRYQPGVA